MFEKYVPVIITSVISGIIMLVIRSLVASFKDLKQFILKKIEELEKKVDNIELKIAKDYVTQADFDKQEEWNRTTHEKLFNEIKAAVKEYGERISKLEG